MKGLILIRLVCQQHQCIFTWSLGNGSGIGAQFGWNWPSGYLKVVNELSLFSYYLSLEEGVSLQRERERKRDRERRWKKVIRKAHLSFQRSWVKIPNFSEFISFSVTSRYHRATKLDTLRVQGCFEMYV